MIRAHAAAKRARLFFDFLGDRRRPVRILDLGGSVAFWNRMGVVPEHGLSIVLLNNHHIDKSNAGYDGHIPFISEVIRDVLVDPHYPHPFVPFFACYPKRIQERLLTLHALGSSAYRCPSS